MMQRMYRACDNLVRRDDKTRRPTKPLAARDALSRFTVHKGFCYGFSTLKGVRVWPHMREKQRCVTREGRYSCYNICIFLLLRVVIESKESSFRLGLNRVSIVISIIILSSIHCHFSAQTKSVVRLVTLSRVRKFFFI